MTLYVKFWGVRGSIACPSPSHVVYGGNTSCIQVEAGDRQIILDAGSGIRPLGKALVAQESLQGTILLTHTHWDHINGFPFFAPAFDSRGRWHVMAGHLYHREGIREVLGTQMTSPMFPVPMEAMQGELTFEDFQAGDAFALGDSVRVRTAPLNHPNGATAYRIEHGGHSVCYVTDTEHVPGQPDRNVLDLIAGADLVIYDSTYTDAEFPDKVGWGHSTWQEGVRLCRQAGVKELAIFHHDPDHDDPFMEHLEDAARALWEHALVARDNMEITVGAER